MAPMGRPAYKPYLNVMSPILEKRKPFTLVKAIAWTGV